MFLGEFQHLVDPKGRVILPSKFRSSLDKGLFITKGLERCLFVYSSAEWKKIEKKVRSLPMTKKSARAFQRNFLSSAIDAIVDKQGRVSIPQYLRKYAKLKKDVVVIGVGTRVEIWDRTEWTKYQRETELEYSEAAEELTDLGI